MRQFAKGSHSLLIAAHQTGVISLASGARAAASSLLPAPATNTFKRSSESCMLWLLAAPPMDKALTPNLHRGPSRGCDTLTQSCHCAQLAQVPRSFNRRRSCDALHEQLRSSDKSDRYLHTSSAPHAEFPLFTWTSLSAAATPARWKCSRDCSAAMPFGARVSSPEANTLSSLNRLQYG